MMVDLNGRFASLIAGAIGTAAGFAGDVFINETKSSITDNVTQNVEVGRVSYSEIVEDAKCIYQ